jgi:hypothetical protein
MVLRRTPLHSTVPQRLRPERPPHGNAIHRALLGRDDGETFAVSLPRA